MQSAGDRILATWVNHPMVTLVDQDFSVLGQSSSVAQCGDGVDNDGDGVSDAADPDCLSSQDDTESGSSNI